MRRAGRLSALPGPPMLHCSTMEFSRTTLRPFLSDEHTSVPVVVVHRRDGGTRGLVRMRGHTSCQPRHALLASTCGRQPPILHHAMDSEGAVKWSWRQTFRSSTGRRRHSCKCTIAIAVLRPGPVEVFLTGPGRTCAVADWLLR